ncbi:MAG: Abi family protein [Flavobacteriales bacterium]|nr:Abi family protein [Flavobacteriales bacterium]
MNFNKKPTSIEEQLELFKSRGLIINNEERVKHYLNKIGYYRLSSYALPFQLKTNPNHKFKTNTSFDDVFNLYLFDRELRILVFDKVEKIEVAIRASMVNHMSLKYGSHWYENGSLFKHWYNHPKLITDIKELVEKSKEVFIKHYVTKYTNPELPPAWMTFELLTFGQIYNIFKALPNTDQKAIANQYNLHSTIFNSWLLTINMVRNTCAHHSRLWNRILGIKPQFPQKQKIHTIEFSNDRLYCILFIIKHLLNTITPSSEFKNQLKELFSKAPFQPTYSIGLPENWEKDPVWDKPIKPY